MIILTIPRLGLEKAFEDDLVWNCLDCGSQTGGHEISLMSLPSIVIFKKWVRIEFLKITNSINLIKRCSVPSHQVTC